MRPRAKYTLEIAVGVAPHLPVFEMRVGVGGAIATEAADEVEVVDALTEADRATDLMIDRQPLQVGLDVRAAGRVGAEIVRPSSSTRARLVTS